MPGDIGLGGIVSGMPEGVQGSDGVVSSGLHGLPDHFLDPSGRVPALHPLDQPVGGLDDIGKELRGTRLSLAETTFDAILRQRIQAGRTTLITTNMTPADLEDGYGAAILSLVREKSLELIFDGTDYRTTARACFSTSRA